MKPMKFLQEIPPFPLKWLLAVCQRCWCTTWEKIVDMRVAIVGEKWQCQQMPRLGGILTGGGGGDVNYSHRKNSGDNQE